MEIILWIIVGAIAGWLASVIMRTNSSQGFIGDVILGIVGAVVGGFLVTFLGGEGFTGFNIYSIIVATLGAVVVLFFKKMLTRPASI